MVVTSQPIERLHYGASRVLDNLTPVAWDRNFELLLLLLSTTITNTSTTTTSNVHHYSLLYILYTGVLYKISTCIQ